MRRVRAAILLYIRGVLSGQGWLRFLSTDNEALFRKGVRSGDSVPHPRNDDLDVLGFASYL
jgi:hypothetical protein